MAVWNRLLNNVLTKPWAKLTLTRSATRSIGGDTRPPSVEDAVIAAELRSRVRSAVDELPKGQREAVRLYYLSGLTQQGAAIYLGISANAVKARLHEAREHLGRELSDLQPRETTMRVNEETAIMRIMDVRMNKEGESHDSHSTSWRVSNCIGVADDAPGEATRTRGQY